MSNQIKINTTFITRPPIVTVLGNVDHGKTTLLDSIRKTTIAAKEAGGITQHIGAYQTELPSANPKNPIRKITFIDTPGHEAFTKMRSRGIQVADIAILMVAVNDGVMPQTTESVKLIQSAKIPCIVALNKIDLPDSQIDKTKQQLVKLGLKLEEYGGETPVVLISAKKGEGIDKLLEMILLISELSQVNVENPNIFQAVVIESTLSKNRGPVATIIVKSGIVSIGEEVVCENQQFKVRALISWDKRNLSQLHISEPAEVLGWKSVPEVGIVLYSDNEQKLSKQSLSGKKSTPSTQSAHVHKENQNTIKIILKADTTGTLEAISANLPESIQTIESGVGNITESDILHAKTVNALVIGFHIKPSLSVVKLAESEKVIIKTYTIIYKLIEEIEEVANAALQGNLAPVLGEAKIQALFQLKDQNIAGIQVIKGRTARGDQVKVMRGDKEIGRARIKSLRHGKEDITKAEQGNEAGVLFSSPLDILTGDSIISIG